MPAMWPVSPGRWRRRCRYPVVAAANATVPRMNRYQSWAQRMAARAVAVANTVVMARQYQRPARMCRGLPLRASAAVAPVMTAVRPATTWMTRMARKAGAVEPTWSPRTRLAVAIGSFPLKCPVSICRVATY